MLAPQQFVCLAWGELRKIPISYMAISIVERSGKSGCFEKKIAFGSADVSNSLTKTLASPGMTGGLLRARA